MSASSFSLTISQPGGLMVALTLDIPNIFTNLHRQLEASHSASSSKPDVATPKQGHSLPITLSRTYLVTHFLHLSTYSLDTLYPSAIKKEGKLERVENNTTHPATIYIKINNALATSTPRHWYASKPKQHARPVVTWKTTKLLVVCVCVYVCVCPHLHSARARLRSQRHSLWPMTVPRLRNPAQTDVYTTGAPLPAFPAHGHPLQFISPSLARHRANNRNWFQFTEKQLSLVGYLFFL